MAPGVAKFTTRLGGWLRGGLRVVRPAQGDEWVPGGEGLVRWEKWGQLAQRVHVGLVPARPTGRPRIIGTGVPNSGEYRWRVPLGLRPGQYRAGVGTVDGRVGDLSDVFTVRAAPAGAVAIGAGEASSYAVEQGGAVAGWGINGTIGYLGDGSLTVAATSPQPVAGLAGAARIAAGSDYVLALDGGGAVWAWGRNTYGNLGDGTTTDRKTPVRVAGLAGVVAVAAGLEALALRQDGSVWSWGYNPFGGGVLARPAPAQVAGIASARAIAAGGGHCLVLDGNGTVWAWGRNEKGQLGSGAGAAGTAGPVQVAGMGPAVAVAAGTAHSAAVAADGTVWTWGSNQAGELGNGFAFSEASSPTPGRVPGVSEMREVAAAGMATFSLGLDDSLWAWGWNQDGQFGLGSTSSAQLPVRVRGGVKAIAPGYRHCLFLTLTGQVLAAGWNENGQLGDGTFESRPTAQPVAL